MEAKILETTLIYLCKFLLVNSHNTVKSSIVAKLSYKSKLICFECTFSFRFVELPLTIVGCTIGISVPSFTMSEFIFDSPTIKPAISVHNFIDISFNMFDYFLLSLLWLFCASEFKNTSFWGCQGTHSWGRYVSMIIILQILDRLTKRLVSHGVFVKW